MHLVTQNKLQPTSYLCHYWNSVVKVPWELLTIWLNLGCPTITEHAIGQIWGWRDTTEHAIGQTWGGGAQRHPRLQL